MKNPDTLEPGSAVWRLVPGVAVVWNATLYEVASIDDMQRVALRNPISAEQVIAPISELSPVGSAVGGAPIDDVIPRELERACAREKVLRPFVLSGERISSEEMAKLKQLLGLKESQIRKLVRQLISSPVPATIVRRPRGRRRNCRMLNVSVEKIVRQCIKQALQEKKTVSGTALHNEVTRRCNAAGLKSPHKQTVARRVVSDGPELRFRRKLGPQRARERVRPKPGVMKTSHVLAQVQIDHSPLDVLLVDFVVRLPIGRAYVTWVTDIHTRTVLGFCVSLEPPSSLTAALALVHAILPKDSWLAERGLVDIEWPMYGVPAVCHADNAPEFKTEAYMEGCRAWGIDPQWRDSGAKEQGAFVERLIGTFQRKAEVLPGATGAGVKQRRGYDPEKSACMTLAEAEIWLAREVAEYHRNTHRTLKMSPGTAWRRAHETDTGLQLPTIVTDRRRLLLDFLPMDSRRVTAVGVTYECNRYWTPALRPLVGFEGRRRFRYDPRDMSKIYVKGFEGHYIEVPFADPTQPAQSKWEMKALRRRSAKLARAEANPEAHARHLDDQHTLVSSAKRATRQRRQEERKRLGKRDAVPPAEVSTATDEPIVQKPRQHGIDYDTPPEITPIGERHD